LQERLKTFPELATSWLLREVRDHNHHYTMMKDFLRGITAPKTMPFEVRFEASPAARRTSDLSHFGKMFTDELRRVAAFEALVGAPEQINDRMHTVYSHKDPDAGGVVYNPTQCSMLSTYAARHGDGICGATNKFCRTCSGNPSVRRTPGQCDGRHGVQGAQRAGRGALDHRLALSASCARSASSSKNSLD
jgi:hypothetical protein